MFMDCSHREAREEQIQPTNALLEGGVHGRLAAVAATRPTSNLTLLSYVRLTSRPRVERAIPDSVAILV